MLGAVALLLMIPWIFFVERMVTRRHAQIEAQKKADRTEVRAQ